jgi:Zn-finger nucleic acid-binding protein
MNCRNCGAAMQPVGGAAYFRCVHCGTFEFPATTDDGVATLTEVTRFPCPVCTDPLTKAAIEGQTICFCGTCRGFLTTNAEFSEVLMRRRAACGDQPSVPRSIDPVELRRRVSCPKCRKPMDTHPYGGGGNVVIDTCHRCHLIWLDAGEMETLARHRPKAGTLGAGGGVLTPLYDGPPREPQSNLRWGWDDDQRHDEFSDGVSLWDFFRSVL